MRKYFIYTNLLVVFFYACNGNNNSDTPVKKLSHAYIEAPVSGKKYKSGDTILTQIVLRDVTQKIDSVVVFLNGKSVYHSNETKNKYIFHISDSNLVLGNYTFEYYLYIGGYKESNRSTIQIVAKNPPQHYVYQVLQAYPHSTDAYTQGLVIHKGNIYEGTGLKGKSELKIIDLITGKSLKTHKLEPQYFGEGITILQDKIYQLTYQNKICFVYDLNFNLIHTFSYDTEGWGLTHDGKNLIMSDGTNRLYFLDPETFRVIRTLEVYDNNIPRYMLNELEMIEGKIWANVYQQNIILIINPQNGAVEAEIDFTGILKDEEYTDNTDVFNGIAFDHTNGNIYVTGKNWPKIFKVKIARKI